MSLLSWHKHRHLVRLDLWLNAESEVEAQSVCAGVSALMHASEPACAEVSRLMRLPSKPHRHQNTPRHCEIDAFDESVQLPRQQEHRYLGTEANDKYSQQVCWYYHSHVLHCSSLQSLHLITLKTILSAYMCFRNISGVVFLESGSQKEGIALFSIISCEACFFSSRRW